MPETIYQEPEEKQAATNAAEIIDQDMLTADPVIERAHTKVNTTGPTVQEWAVPPLSNETIMEETTAGTQQKEQPQSQYANEELKDMPHSSKKQAAEHLAHVIVDGYEYICTELGNMTLLVSKRKANKLHASGDIDLGMPVALFTPTAPQATITARAFIDQYNESVSDCIKPDPEFKAKVLPLIVEELAKRDMGLSNMQLLMFYVATDLVSKGKQWAEGFRQRGEMLEILKANTKLYRQNGFTGHVTAPAPPPAQTPPPEPQQPAYTPPPAPPPQFDTTSANSFDDIQAARGGGNIIPPNAAPDFNRRINDTLQAFRKKAKGRPPGSKNKSKKRQ